MSDDGLYDGDCSSHGPVTTNADRADVVAAPLQRLRDAADVVGAGWSPSTWRIADGGGPERTWGNEASPDSIGSLIDGLGDLDVSKRPVLRTSLDVPDRLHGVDLVGDALELTVVSIYPLEISIDGKTLVAESVPPVALGPALVDVVERIDIGRPADFAARIEPCDGHRGGALTWLDFRFTTPRLRNRFEVLDLAWARLALASRLASTTDEWRAVHAGCSLIPDVPLDLEDAELEGALRAMAEELSPLAERVADLEVHVIGHSHVDLAWLWTWDDAREVIKRDVRSVLAIMNDYPEVTFTHSQPAGYDVIRRDEPELFAEIVRLVHAGRWEPATAQWVEGDTNLASGEAMASQLLEGVSFSRERLGIRPRVFFAPDTFGHSANMPQLVADAGVDVYVHARCNPGDAAGGRWPAYWWEGPDGTRVLACSPDSYNGTVTPGEIARAALRALSANLQVALLFVGVGDHGGGPTRHGYDILRRVGTAFGMPRSHCSTVGAYADQLKSQGAQLPVHRGESSTIFEGCYTTHADVKQANRAGENLLMTAETLAALSGLVRPAELGEAWRRLCFNQFHDIVGGAAVPEVYRHARADSDWIRDVAETVTARSLGVLGASAPSGSIVVVNPHGHMCADVVAVAAAPAVSRPVLVDESGRRTPGQIDGDDLVFVAEVPAFGVSRYQLLDDADDESPTEDLTVAESSGNQGYLAVETPHFRTVIRRDCGVIVSLVDKRCGRELVAYGMRRATDYGDTARPDLGLNVIQLVDELPHFMSAWQFHEVHAEHSVIDGATTEVLEQGPVRVVVRVAHDLRQSRIVEDIVFYRDIARIDLVVHVDWHEPAGDDHGIPNLKLAFVPDLDQPTAWFEAPYCAVRRRANGQQVPALRWADLSEPGYGVAVLNDSTHGHDVLGNRIRLTLMRTTYLPDPRSDEGSYVFRVSLVPHEQDWRAAAVPHLAALFNQPLVATYVDSSGGDVSSMPGWRPTIETRNGLTSSSLRLGRDGSSTVVRIAEAAGEPADVSIRGVPQEMTAWTSSITEDRGAPLANLDTGIALAMRPWEVRTLLIGR